MKLIVNKSVLEVCVKNLCKVIPSKPALPILTDIKFNVDEKCNCATLTASDSEMWLSYDIPLSECEGGGSFCVSGDSLAAMIGELKEQPLTILATIESNKKFTLIHEDGAAYCAIEDANEYPSTIKMDENPYLIDVDPKLFKRAIKRCAWATCNDDLRPVLNGVYCNIANGLMDVVATDGHKVMKTTLHIEYLGEDTHFLMPKSAAKIVMNILSMDEDETASLTVTGGAGMIEQENYCFIFRQIDGKYPNYNAVIPIDHPHEVIADRADLISALKAVEPFSPDSSNMVTMAFLGDRLDIRGEDYDFATGANKSIAIEGFGSEQLTIGIKASIMIKILMQLDSQNVIMRLKDKNSAITIEPDTDDKEEVKEEIIAMAMPMFTND